MSSTDGAYARSLPPDHHCRVDDLTYRTVSEWFRDHHGRVPIQMAVGLTAYMKAQECSFADAFTALSAEGGPIILIEDELSTGQDE